MAYGGKQIKKVSKIVGPGNIYVTAAKKIVFGKVGIDSLAGPSEIVVIADKTANPKFIAKLRKIFNENNLLSVCVLKVRFKNKKSIAMTTLNEKVPGLNNKYPATTSKKKK